MVMALTDGIAFTGGGVTTGGGVVGGLEVPHALTTTITAAATTSKPDLRRVIDQVLSTLRGSADSRISRIA